MKKLLLIICLILLPSLTHAAGQNFLTNGLVGYWTFDGADTLNGVAKDVSGQGNTGNLLNIATSTFYAPAKINQGFNFDGVDDYISGPHLTQLETGNFSFSVWVKPKALATSWIMQQWDGGKGPALYMIGGSGNFEWQVGGDDILLNSFFAVDTWVHVVVIANGTSLSVYKNGVLVAGPTVKTRTDSVAGNFTIGGPNEGSVAYFSGLIDDARVYGRALSATEVLQLYNSSQLVQTSQNFLTSGLKGWWTFDGKDMPSGRTNDLSGNGNTGYASGISTSTFYTTGKIGQATNYDGVDDQVTVSNFSFLTAPFTLHAKVFFNSSTAGTYNPIITRGNVFQDNTNFAFGLKEQGTTIFCYWRAGSTLYGTEVSSALIVKNKWLNIDCAIDASWNVTIYVDGVSVGTDGSNLTPVDGSQSLIIGAGTNDGTSANFIGKLDDVRIYNRALSATEITQLYSDGQVIQTSQNFPTNGLIGWWTMDGKDVPWTSATAATAIDRSGSGNTGTLTNMARSTSPAAGKIRQGLYFNTDDRIDFASDFIDVNTVTICAWAFSPTPNASGAIMGNARFLFGQYTQNSTYVLYSNTSAGNPLIGTTNAAVANTWQHVCVVRNSGANGPASLYVNGVLNVTGNSVTPTAGFGLSLGNDQFNEYPWNGYLDDVRVYNRALSATEVLQLYNYGKSLIK